MTRARFAAALAAASALATPAMATVDPVLFQELHWRSIGPSRGGRVLAVTGAPDNAQHFYMGAVNGGVWETNDAGRTWHPISDAVPNGSIGSIAVAADAKTLYIGTGEADMRSDISQGIGAFRSVDGGHSWEAAGLKGSQAIAGLRIDPRDPNIVLAAVLGHPYGPNAERGVLRTTDGGRTWTRTLFRDVNTGAIDLAVRPDNPDIVFAALWQTRRPPWSIYPPSNGPGSGLWKSTDAGRSWAPLAAKGLPAAPGRIGLTISTSHPNTMYAVIDATDGGIFRSDDGGATWVHTSTDKRVWGRGWYFGGVTVDPRDPETLYVMNTATYRSTDGGRSFVPIKGAPGGDDYHALWIDPANPARRILGVDQGAVISMNGGATWSSWFNQPTAQMYHVVTDNRFPYWVYGAQQDSGAASVPSRTTSIDSINMTEFREVTAGGESGNIAPDPDDPDTIFGGNVEKLDLKTGQTKNVDPTLAYPGAYRAEWTLPLVFGKRGAKSLYFGNQRVFRTRDGGAHWVPISPDLTRADPGVPPNLDPVTAGRRDNAGQRQGVVYTIAPSPLSAHTVWAGTDDGLVWRTDDDGAHWRDLTPRGLPDWSKIGAIEPSHFSPDVAYLAIDRHRVDDFAPYVLRTRDGGRSWTPIVAGLVGDGPLNAVNVVREDPVRAGLLYAGTERGTFVSFDDGVAWQPLEAALPPTSVRDIEVHGDDLVIATHGRGFYILDDVAPLRALAADPASTTRLLPLARAIRLRPSGFTGSPMPKDEPMAANPPDGAYLDYVLAAPARALAITVRDASGAEVRQFRNTDPAPAPDLGKIDIAPEWITASHPLRATAGMHRLVWDLHYAAPENAKGGTRGDGVWAPPGRYIVTLDADGLRSTQQLTLAPDPRVHATPADYAAQFALARRIEAARTQVDAALEAATTLDKTLAADSAVAAQALDARLRAIADFAPASFPTAPPTLPGGLRALSDRLAGLARAVDNADGRPTPDATVSTEQTLASAAGALGEVKALRDAVSPSSKPFREGIDAR